ncbi:hypothetical protein [Arthrobacter wenxiniae]|uniref:Uncharacterized protein n=1 Tax=Arthrobacter wenxiniae TaxID=2713570 RepID=A0A7Y7IJ21_9MICC|nr:hypothetical protein [Arthrobacter wenxiniae]NVM96162.1 hypothetical protein [Arthrobacter wenxiniae]
MSDALFDFDSPDELQPAPAPQRDIPIKDHQVQQIREGLDAAGIIGLEERQNTIQRYISRQVPSLSDLHAHEAHAIIQRLKQLQSATPTKTGSAWDQREEDTWIDKL